MYSERISSKLNDIEELLINLEGVQSYDFFLNEVEDIRDYIIELEKTIYGYTE